MSTRLAADLRRGFEKQQLAITAHSSGTPDSQERSKAPWRSNNPVVR